MFEGLEELGNKIEPLVGHVKLLNFNLAPVIEGRIVDGRRKFFVFIEDDGERRFFMRSYFAEDGAKNLAGQAAAAIANATNEVTDEIKSSYLLDESGAQVLHARPCDWYGNQVSRGSPARVTKVGGVPTISVRGRPTSVAKVIAMLSETLTSWQGDPVPITRSRRKAPIVSELNPDEQALRRHVEQLQEMRVWRWIRSVFFHQPSPTKH